MAGFFNQYLYNYEAIETADKSVKHLALPSSRLRIEK